MEGAINTKKVKIIKDFVDKETGNVRKLGTVATFDDERAKIMINNNLAVKIEDEIKENKLEENKIEEIPLKFGKKTLSTNLKK